MASRFQLTSAAELELASTIETLELVRVQLPLMEPFVAAHGTETTRDLVLVHVVGADGVSGWGECEALGAATYTSEDAEGAWRFLLDHLGPAVLAGRPVDVRPHPMAWTAVQVAILDLSLRRSGVALAVHLGATRTSVPSGAVIGRRDSIDEVLAAVAGHLDDEVALIKLKIAPGWDVEPLAAVRATWPDLPLAADANGAYRADDTVWPALDALGLAYIEQPLGRAEVEATVALQRRLRTPIALDESIRSADDLRFWIECGFTGVVNIKASRVGGTDEAMAAISLAVAGGLGAFVGGMLEGGVGRATSLALAGLTGLTIPTDLGPSARYFDRDLTDPFVLTAGHLTVPAGPGIGVVPRPDRLAACTVSHRTMRR